VNGTSIWPEAYERHFHLAGAAAESRAVLASAMSRYAGVLRDAGGLERLTAIIAGARHRDAGKDTSASTGKITGCAIPPGAPAEAPHALADDGTGPALADVEAANLREASALIAAAALHRTESRGCHRRSDATGTEPAGRHTLARRDGERIIVNLEESA
jgi:aspartate oxidase